MWMRDGIGVAILGGVVASAGAAKIALGGIDGLFTAGVGLLISYAGVQDAKIRPPSDI